MSEFLKVVSQVIEMCEQERKNKVQQGRIQEVYGNGIRYEQHKIFSQLNHSNIDDGEEDAIETSAPLHMSPTPSRFGWSS